MPIATLETVKTKADVLFGPFRLAPAERLLEKSGVAVQLGGRALDILIVLLERAGEVVSKRDLIQRVWPDVTVDEGSLRFHIGALRKALGDGESGARYVTNVPGRGYCFVEPVRYSTVLRPAATDGPTFDQNHRLPSRLMRMVGRDEIVQAVASRVLDQRFVSVVGPGGIGKTTVAVSVAHVLLAEFPGAVRFIDLGALNDHRLVASNVATVLGLPVGSDNAAAILIHHLRDKRMLLVFDCCEHLVEAVAELSETIFLEGPGIHILATSRESLRVEGEHVHRLFPLDYPPDDIGLTADEALEFPAVQLFMERFAANSNRFPLSDREAPTIAEICRKLDGIPLAIEFAAARAAALGVVEVATHLNNRFELLTKGRRTALSRHQTLRAVLDWSYQLLPEPERHLLCRLAVFSGGFTLDAATAVASSDDDGAPSVVEGIANLFLKSLLTPADSRTPDRWRLLDTTRTYALEKLSESGERNSAARRHAEYFRNYFEALDERAKIEATAEDQFRHRQEIDNVRAALDWAFSSGGDTAIGVALTAAYAWIWLQLSSYFECSERAEQALKGLGADTDLNVASRLQLLLALAMSLTNTMGPVETTRNILVTACQIADRHNDLAVHLWILWALWSLQLNIGECHAARTTAEKYCRIAPATDDPGSFLPGHRLLGTAIQLGGDQHEARRHLERALEPPFTEDDPLHPVWPKQHRAMTSATLARTLWLQGFADQACNLARESFAEADAGPVVTTRFEVLRLAVCPVAFMIGDLAAAENGVAAIKAIANNTSTVFWKVVAQSLEGTLLIRRGEFERGVIALGALLDNCNKTGWKSGYPGYLGVLAEGLAGLGRYAEAIATVDRALAAANDGGECWCVAELLRIKGEFLLRDLGNNAFSVAEDWFREALQLAHRQGALAWELRAAVSLAGLKVSQGRQNDASRILAPVYYRFSEGFETNDLRSARTMLESL
jgi:predicted ATPase/DNA-binding winged helix-turn-helix (wHTH) protein